MVNPAMTPVATRAEAQLIPISWREWATGEGTFSWVYGTIPVSNPATTM